MKTIKRILAITLLLAAGAAQAATIPAGSIIVKGPDTSPGTELSDSEPCKDQANYVDSNCYYETPNYLVLAPVPGQPGEYYIVDTISSDPFLDYVVSPPSEVPLPPSAWLLGTALFGLVSIARRRRDKVIVVDAPTS